MKVKRAMRKWESHRWLERARDCWRGQEELKEPGIIIDSQKEFERVREVEEVQGVLKRAMEYPKARDGTRESKSVEEVQGVLEWVSEGR